MSIKAYQNNSVETASPGELTLMLYNGCIKFIKAARKAMENKEIEAKNTNIQKAQAIVRELMVTVNTEYEVSNELLPLYDYMNRRLMEANIQNNDEVLEEVQGLATEFRNTWKEVLKESRKAQHAAGDGV